jgi:long-chain acyl-CoA synthetase
VSEPRNVPELFLERVGKTPDVEAFRHPKNGRWASLTWRETETRVRALSAGLRALGVRDEEVCAILATTRIEWILADLGILCAGAATSTIYPSTLPEECAFILADSGAVLAFAENDEQVAKLASRRSELPHLRNVVTFDGKPTSDGWVIRFEDLEARGRKEDSKNAGRFEEGCAAIRNSALATLIYTSGTTGQPKGVELTHGCWISQSRSIEESGILNHEDPMQFFWLPLAHVFGKMIGTAQLRIGFPTTVDGRIEKIVDNLAKVKPTFVCAVPRIFEKVYAKIVSTAREGGPVKSAVFDWAMSVGKAFAAERRAGRTPGLVLELQHALADRLVFTKIRGLFGGRLKFFVSGSAPLSRDIGEFFDALGVLILEGYGLTESSAATHVNLPWKRKLGSGGPPCPGMEVKIAEDGEILLRGPWIMRG